MKLNIRKYNFIILLISVSCAYYNTFFNTQKFFKEAEKEREKSKTDVISSTAKQKYNKAIEKASRLLELYPNSKYVDDALLILGKSFFYRSEYRKAKRKFEELINNFPKSEFVAEARLWLGKTNTNIRDYETAKKNFQNILKSKADRKITDEAQFLLGELYFHKEDYISALSEYKIAARVVKDKALRAEVYYQMGECYLQLRDFAAAASSFEKARKYSPDAKFEFQALFKAGLAQKDLSQYNQAIKIFTDLLGDIANEDNWPQCKLEIADCLYLKGELNNAISWYESIINDHKKTDAAAKAYFNLGVIYQKEKSDYNQAKEYYDLAIQEYRRSDIVVAAKANSKSIQDLLALRKDIKEQEKRIAVGDSIAAMMDSLAVDNMTDSLKTGKNDSSTSHTADSFQTKDSTKFKFNQFFNDEGDFSSTNHKKRAKQKIALKTGKLGTPKKELIKDKLMLAEIYLLDFNQPDSAIFQYLDILHRDTSVETSSKAAYSIGYIFENYKKDLAVADSIYRKLIEAYPNTIYAEKARQKLNLPKITKTEDIVHKTFIEAEKEYLDYNNITQALALYEKIVDNYPSSIFCPKALFAMGWIYENNLNENDKALEIYQKLLNNYPDTDHAKKVKKKIEEVDKQRQLEKQKIATGDTTSLASQSLASKQTKSNNKKVYEITDLSKIDKENYRKLLRKEMEKDNNRIRNPKRIIK